MSGGVPDTYFERLYEADPDPWDCLTSSYEAEKLAATIAALPAGRRSCVLELGCGIGLLTAALADRARQVIALDCSSVALSIAGRRLAERANVRLRRALLPDGVPPGRFDLVVASEVLYYLDDVGLDELLREVRARVMPGGCVVSVCWRGPTSPAPLSGQDVRSTLRAAFSDWELDAPQTTTGFLLDVARRPGA